MEEQSEYKKKRSEKIISFGENETKNKNEKHNGNNLIKNTEQFISNGKEDQDGEEYKK